MFIEHSGVSDYSKTVELWGGLGSEGMGWLLFGGKMIFFGGCV